MKILLISGHGDGDPGASSKFGSRSDRNRGNGTED